MTVLIVIGGSNYNRPEAVSTRDIYINGSWVVGPKLGIGTWTNGAYVTYEDNRGIVLIGSKSNHNPNKDLSDKLVSFNEDTQLFKKLHLGLKYSRVDPASVIIPKNGINCR